MERSKHIAVLGGGSWGTALATLLANNGHRVMLWCYEKNVADEINLTHQNTSYLPGITLSANITATSDLQELAQSSELIVEVVPVTYLRSVLKKFAPFVTPSHRWLIASKGIENNTLLLPSQIIEQVCGAATMAVVAGPNFAKDLAQQVFTGSVIAGYDQEFVDELISLFSSSYAVFYPSFDFFGIQAASALKVLITLALGIAQGGECGENTRSYLLTVGMNEMARVVTAFGGQHITAYGLAGLGDLVLCAVGSQSRNLKAGALLGKGCTLVQVEQACGFLPEGINTAYSISQWAFEQGVSIPMCQLVVDVMQGRLTFESYFEKIVSQTVMDDFSLDVNYKALASKHVEQLGSQGEYTNF
jgi:glycerol-3-phosphate dehydrogenase (NAD(P)+)